MQEIKNILGLIKNQGELKKYALLVSRAVILYINNLKTNSLKCRVYSYIIR